MLLGLEITLVIPFGQDEVQYPHLSSLYSESHAHHPIPSYFFVSAQELYTTEFLVNGKTQVPSKPFGSNRSRDRDGQVSKRAGQNNFDILTTRKEWLNSSPDDYPVYTWIEAAIISFPP